MRATTGISGQFDNELDEDIFTIVLYWYLKDPSAVVMAGLVHDVAVAVSLYKHSV